MSHLLAISIGPVQVFIAAARRTRDLWFGSDLLSEISRATAKSIEHQGGKLIFPASSDAENVANVILAELSSGDPKGVASEAKQAAWNHWRQVASKAREVVSEVICDKIWLDQVDGVIEFYAAWVVQTSDGYSADRRRLMRILSGRKNCRDFAQATLLDAGLPKSSLDGQRATVLVGPTKSESPATYRNQWSRSSRRKLRVRSGEQLDVVGVIKRVGEGAKPFPSVARIAGDVWIRGILNQGGEEIIRRFVKYCETLPRDLVHRLDPFPQFRDFSFEGTALFRTRHHEWWEETDDMPERERDQPELPEWYADFDQQLKLVEEFAAQQRVGKEPNPYLAVLVADGDQMGAAISSLGSANANRAFSYALAGFADEARRIVNNHNGVLVYAGGDDVLAFLPVDKCLVCARELRELFVENLAGYKNGQDESPTLSVGIAIGHFMENLEDLLDYGRAAEKAAKKPDRDGLAVHLHKRGGAPIRLRSQWNTNLDERLIDFAKLMNKGIISTRLPYELRAMASHYSTDTWSAESAEAAIKVDLVRLIAKKQSREIETVRAALARHLDGMTAKRLQNFAKELLLARQLATALKQSGGGAK